MVLQSPMRRRPTRAARWTNMLWRSRGGEDQQCGLREHPRINHPPQNTSSPHRFRCKEAENYLKTFFKCSAFPNYISTWGWIFFLTSVKTLHGCRPTSEGRRGQLIFRKPDIKYICNKLFLLTCGRFINDLLKLINLNIQF